MIKLAWLFLLLPAWCFAISNETADLIVARYESLDKSSLAEKFFKTRSKHDYAFFKSQQKNLVWPKLAAKNNLILVRVGNSNFEFDFKDLNPGEVVVNGTISFSTKKDSLEEITTKLSTYKSSSFYNKYIFSDAHAVYLRVILGVLSFIPDILAVKDHMDEIRRLEADCDKIRKNIQLFQTANSKSIEPAFADLLKIQIKAFLGSVKNKDYPTFACYKDLNKALKSFEPPVCE